MAKIYGEIASSALMTFDKSFSRSNGQPLDSTEVYYSKAAAEAYALTDVAYVGQKLVVIETIDDVTTVSHYGIEADGSLKELGAIPVGDGMTVEVVDGKIQLAELEGHTTGTYQPYLVDGKIEWRVPSATTVEGLDSRLTTAEGDIDALETAVANVYTKEEADAKFAPVGDYATKEEAQGYADAKDEAIAAAKQAGDDAQADVDALVEKIGEVAEDKTVVQMIADAQTAATYDDTELAGRVTDVEDEIGVASAEGVAATGLHARIEGLEGLVGTEKVSDAIAAEATRAQGVESGLETRLKAVEDDYLKATDKTELEDAIDAAEESAVNRVLGYLAEEEVNASYDTLKEVAAWIESDTTNSAQLISRVSAIEADYLKGADKEALEGEIDALSEFIGDLPEGAASATVVAYIQEVVNGLKIGDYAKAADLTALADRVAALEGKAHEHENKTVLDGITAEKVAAWDGAEQNAKDYADGLNDTVMDLIDGVDAALEGKVAVEEGKSLIADTLIAKLEGIAEGAQVNVIDSVDETQFAIDEAKKLTLLDIAMGKVTGLQDALDAKANKGTTLADYGITDAYTKNETLDKIAEKITEINGGESAGEVLGQLNSYKETNDARVGTIEAKIATIEEGAQVNKIEQIKLGANVLEIVDKTVVIPVGAGLKASDEITIAEDGALGVSELNVKKLVQGEDEWLILNGGASK